MHPMTDDSLELIAAARSGVERAWREGFAYTKAGVILEELVAADERPRTLFEDAEGRDRRQRLMGAIDEINERFGKFAAIPGVQGFRREWKQQASMKSPAWTTRIEEVPRVRAK